MTMEHHLDLNYSTRVVLGDHSDKIDLEYQWHVL
jgi:hypothetical protein